MYLPFSENNLNKMQVIGIIMELNLHSFHILLLLISSISMQKLH